MQGQMLVQVEKWDFQVDVLFEWLTLEEASMVDGWQLSFLPHHELLCFTVFMFCRHPRPLAASGSRAADRALWEKLLATEAASRTGERGHRRLPRSVTADEVRNIRTSQIDLCSDDSRVHQCIEQERTHHLLSGNMHSEIFAVEFEPKRAPNYIFMFVLLHRSRIR